MPGQLLLCRACAAHVDKAWLQAPPRRLPCMHACCLPPSRGPQGAAPAPPLAACRARSWAWRRDWLPTPSLAACWGCLVRSQPRPVPACLLAAAGRCRTVHALCICFPDGPDIAPSLHMSSETWRSPSWTSACGASCPDWLHCAVSPFPRPQASCKSRRPPWWRRTPPGLRDFLWRRRTAGRLSRPADGRVAASRASSRQSGSSRRRARLLALLYKLYAACSHPQNRRCP